MDGWIKSYRSIMDNPIVCKDVDHYAVWGYLIHNAAHTPTNVLFNGERIILRPGQLITGRKKIASFWGINEHKIDRILKRFEIEQQIEQVSSPVCRLISITNWAKYQSSEQPIEQRLSNLRATPEQPLSTIQEYKNIRKKEDSSSVDIDTNTIKSKNITRTREKREKPVEPIVVDLELCRVSGSEWRENFAAYQTGLRQCYDALRRDAEWLAERRELNPGVDIVLTLKKCIVEFWGTEAGWQNKKAKRTTTIDWKQTLTNAISQKHNRVYEQNGISGNGKSKRGNALTSEYLVNLACRSMSTD